MPESPFTSKETDHLFPPVLTQGTDPKLLPRPVKKFGYLLDWRFLLFVLLELGFIALTWSSLTRYIPLSFANNSNLSLAKIGSVAVFSVWHAIAIACGINTCLNSFSREWAARPQKTDKVSTVSSGTIDRIEYFFKARATKTFRVALFVALALQLLQIVGTSIITVTTARNGLITVATMTALPNLEFTDLFFSKLSQVNVISKVEQLQGFVIGIEPEPNWFIPLPTINTTAHDTLPVVYNTDLVRFNYSCHWQAPDNVTIDEGVLVGNITWRDRASTAFGASLSGVGNMSRVVQLAPFSVITDLSIFMFMGELKTTNTTTNISDILNEAGVTVDQLPLIIKNADWKLDLRGLPTANLREMTNDTTVVPLATLLVCDPQLYFTTGTVRFSPALVPDTPDLVVVSENRHSDRFGNIDDDTVRNLFSWALITTSGPIDGSVDLDTNTMGQDLLLSFLSHEPSTSDADIFEWWFAPRNHTAIESRLGVYMRSALKVFTKGYYTQPGSAPDPSFQPSTHLPAHFENDRPALTSNLPFAVCYSVLFVTAACGLVGLMFLNSTQGRVPFALKCVEEEFDKNGTPKVEGGSVDGPSTPEADSVEPRDGPAVH